ncbi:hypothetical protein ACIPLC_10920 [Kitasatospora sp. NPDC086801]|uniref:hypothetical protein n=1 Tax=Kitasatospora sp. NPDC086801 TaxID=3364066 RepID=UPI003829701D
MRDQTPTSEDEAARRRRAAPDRRSTDLPAEGVREAAAGGPLSPSTALPLQRALGNAAVARLVERQRHGHDASGGRPGAGAPVQRAPTPGAAPATQIALTHLPGDDLEGECGYFERRRQLSVNAPQQGVIIQEINRVFAVEEWDGEGWTAMPGARIDTYITAKGSSAHATVARYWELWTVDAAGNVSDGAEDTFSLCSVIPGRKRKDTTRGTYTITGRAVFYPTVVAPADLGFAQGGAPPAGGLFSTLADPSAAIAGQGLAASGSPVDCRVRVSWDSSQGDRYSEVEMT